MILLLLLLLFINGLDKRLKKAGYISPLLFWIFLIFSILFFLSLYWFLIISLSFSNTKHRPWWSHEAWLCTRYLIFYNRVGYSTSSASSWEDNSFTRSRYATIHSIVILIFRKVLLKKERNFLCYYSNIFCFDNYIKGKLTVFFIPYTQYYLSKKKCNLLRLLRHSF